jgi:hypothetical protein
MSEYPRPVRLPGEPTLPREPYETSGHAQPPDVVDEDVDVFGAEEVAAQLTQRIEQVRAGAAHRAADGRTVLSPPWDPDRDHVDGPRSPRAVLLVFGAYGTPVSRPLADVLAEVRARYTTSVAVSWRHHPDPVAHPHAVMLALATEAAVDLGRFWALTHELLQAGAAEPGDLWAAMRRVRLDPDRALEAMRAGTGADRIVDDVASALHSGVTYSPALFVDGERYEGELDPAAVVDALREA